MGYNAMKLWHKSYIIETTDTHGVQEVKAHGLHFTNNAFIITYYNYHYKLVYILIFYVYIEYHHQHDS